jgi:hypothetical protein
VGPVVKLDSVFTTISITKPVVFCLKKLRQKSCISSKKMILRELLLVVFDILDLALVTGN